MRRNHSLFGTVSLLRLPIFFHSFYFNLIYQGVDVYVYLTFVKNQCGCPQFLYRIVVSASTKEISVITLSNIYVAESPSHHERIGCKIIVIPPEASRLGFPHVQNFQVTMLQPFALSPCPRRRCASRHKYRIRFTRPVPEVFVASSTNTRFARTRKTSRA